MTFTDPQIQCGGASRILGSSVTISQDHSQADLTAKATNLKFDDDVIIRDLSPARALLSRYGVISRFRWVASREQGR